MNDYQTLWNRTLEEFKLFLNEDAFDETFSDVKSVFKFSNGSIYVLCPTQYIKHKINDVYSIRLNEILQGLTSETMRFKFVTKEEVATPEDVIDEAKKPVLFKSNLDPNYTFQSFVSGKSNMFAYRSAMQCADQGAFLANPLYIFGGVGLGKTHLMQAIGNYMIDKDINKKVYYIQTQQFISQYVKATQTKNFEEFKKTYENLDCLLVDDIQMLAEASKTQEQFFDIFNVLYQSHKLIVITSDKPANQLTIMERLRSRFSWGMQVDIQKPDLEHRVLILKRKLLESSEEIIPDEVLYFIAQNFPDNIRDLEGALRRVLNYSIMMNDDITLALAKESLEPMLRKIKNDDDQNYENLMSVVCGFYGIDHADLIGPKRISKYILARHICMYILKTKYNLPYQKIGYLFGGRDHSTVLSAVEKIDLQLKSDAELKMAVNAILKKIE